MKVLVQAQTHVSECRRAVASLAAQVRLDERDAGRAALVATELATNLYKHGGRGEFHAGACELGGPGIHMLALDRGPGIQSLAEAFRDGYSTAGSPGTGLGAITRVADSFDIFSQPDRGTAICASVQPDGGTAESFAAVGSSMAGEVDSGDGWCAELAGGKLRVLLSDGLGHGILAAEATRQAIAGFRRSLSLPPGAVIGELHSALRPTRGAAVAIAEIDFDAGRVSYAGVGNLSAVILSSTGIRGMVSLAGTVGHTIQRVQQFEYDFPVDALMVLNSDGLRHWDLGSYPGLVEKSPRLVAGILYRDFTRGRDDVMVVAVRRRPEKGSK